MKKNNGFINSLMLLLIILSGATFAISFGNVKKHMIVSHDNAFINDAKIYVKAAKIWYTSESVINGISGDVCVTFDTLYNNKYLEHNDYNGYIEFVNDTSILYMTNGQKGIYGVSFELMDPSKIEIKNITNIDIPSYCR